MKKEDIVFAKQLIETSRDSLSKLKVAYEKKNVEEFNKLKKIILKSQEDLANLVK